MWLQNLEGLASPPGAAKLYVRPHPTQFPMLTYIYETLPRAGKTVRRFEIRQSIKDAPLTKHPTTGERIRRCIVLSTDPFVRAATIERPEPRTKTTRSRQHDDHHDHHDHDHHH